jgi:hypothetical protein
MHFLYQALFRDQLQLSWALPAPSASIAEIFDFYSWSRRESLKHLVAALTLRGRGRGCELKS